MRFSSQAPRVARRPVMTDALDSYRRLFLSQLQEYTHRIPSDLIINMDETMIRQVPAPNRVWGIRGAPWRLVKCHANPKNGITSCITVVSDGTSLPVFVLKKGKTPRCLDSLQLDNKTAKGTFSPRGWSTSDAMRTYLDQIIIPYTKGRECLLIWDVHASHIHESIREHCQKNKINTLIIPAGMTHIYQPCDTHVIGILKKRLSAIWSLKLYDNPDYETPLSIIIKDVCAIMQAISKVTIQKSFKKVLFEPAIEHVIHDILNNIVSRIECDAKMAEIDTFIQQLNARNTVY